MKPLRFNIKDDGLATHAFMHDDYAFCLLISEVCSAFWLRIQIADNIGILLDVDFGNYSNINSTRLAAWLLKKFILNHHTASIINTIKEQQVIKNMKKRI
jgi:hypothetical protein